MEKKGPNRDLNPGPRTGDSDRSGKSEARIMLLDHWATFLNELTVPHATSITLSPVPPTMFGQLESRTQLQWTPAQENTINREYPFTANSQGETQEQFVVRHYLQFLWLPCVRSSLPFVHASLMMVSSRSCP